MKKIIVTGGSGFFGTQLIKELLKNTEYEIVVLDLVPPKIEDNRISFAKQNLLDDFSESTLNALENPFAYFHLSGKNIFGRFTEEHKDLIYRTRVDASYHLISLFEDEKYRPQKFISASAVGFYGDQIGIELDESSEQGERFLAQVVHDWEEAVHSAQDFRVETHSVRNGHIIGKGGIAGVVAQYSSFKVGQVLGDGKAHFPWVDIDDLVLMYTQFLENNNLPSVINGVSETNDTHEDFGVAVGKKVDTWFTIHVPRFLLRLRFGSFADEMLADQKVVSKYTNTYTPRYTNLIERVNYHLE